MRRKPSIKDRFIGCKEDAYGDSISIVNQLAEEMGVYKMENTNNSWIPCSERLPKDEELSQRKEVIVQNRYGEIFTA